MAVLPATAGQTAQHHVEGDPAVVLQAYSSNLVDYHLILDLLPSLSRLYLSGQLPATLSYGQAAILLCLGLQQRELSEVEAALGLPSNQVS
jgi:N-acetyltransferase 10